MTVDNHRLQGYTLAHSFIHVQDYFNLNLTAQLFLLHTYMDLSQYT